jgi:hypothetical protein
MWPTGTDFGTERCASSSWHSCVHPACLPCVSALPGLPSDLSCEPTPGFEGYQHHTSMKAFRGLLQLTCDYSFVLNFLKSCTRIRFVLSFTS